MMCQRSNFYLRALTDWTLSQRALGAMSNTQAAEQMHKDGVPLHVALRTLAGRTTQ